VPHFWNVKDIQLYYDYFRHQAETHNLLLHQETEGQRVFEIIEIEDALGDFRSGVKRQDYIMRLINYTFVVGQRSHQATKELQGGFIIAKWYNENEGGKAAYINALVAAEQVMNDMISKMIIDSRNGHPLFDNYFDSEQDINVQPVRNTGDGSYAGWMAIFRTDQFFDNCFTPDAARWSDGGQTPYAEE
jgi:hypothetical protein